MSEPLALAVVREDDRLLDRLAQGRPSSGQDDSLSTVLLAWRGDILDQLPIDDGFESAVAPAAPTRHRLRVRPSGTRARSAVVAAGVAGLLAALGVTAAASQATPGSVLFPLTKVVAAQHAQSVQAREDVRAALQRAERQAAEGDMAGASETLRSAQQRVTDVRAQDGRAALLAQLRQAESSVGTPTAPGVSATAGPSAAPSPPAVPNLPSPTPQSSPEPEPTPQPTSPPPEPSPEPTPSPAAAPDVPDDPE